MDDELTLDTLDTRVRKLERTMWFPTLASVVLTTVGVFAWEKYGKGHGSCSCEAPKPEPKPEPTKRVNRRVERFR